LGNNTHTIQKNTENLIDACTCKEVGLGENAEKTKRMLLSHHQNAMCNLDMKRANRSFENVAQFECLEKTVTSPILIQEEIKRKWNSGNVCYHSVQNLLPSHPLSKNVNIRIHTNLLCGST
jgi:hypothetical protein